MWSGSRIKPKREEDSDGQGRDGAAEAWLMTEHRERVKEMAAKMAAEAGLGRADRAGGGGSGGKVMTTAVEMDMAKHPEQHGEAVPATIKTPRYDGKSNWEAFQAQFELLAQASKWSTSVKALQLAMCLTGDALSSLLLLSHDDRRDYDALIGALKRRFGQCSCPSLLRSELCSRQRRPEEPLRELANDIEGLVHCTYAHMPPPIQSELARDYFLQALLPTDLRIQTLLAHPGSLQESLESATEREMLCAGAVGKVVEKSTKVRTAGETDMDLAQPAWVGELTQLVRAATLRDERQDKP
ncbi:hypothetical protein VZT92_021257 [Zoarces viviparus]|uniref:Gag protein n=1 Tax=Zoarces viviparus TaxID=48416 RepID=A0AAW1EHL9_ZOAVI